MEQFSLEKYLENPNCKVVTRDGRPVRIVCWDRNTKYWKIVGLVTSPDGSTENPFTYDVNGNESDGCLHDHRNDLFFAGEKSTEFEKALLAAFNCVAGKAVTTIGTASFQEEVDEWSKPLLDLARKELRKEQQEKLGTLEMPIDVTEPYYIKGKEDAGEAKVKELVAEFEKGRQSVLKDLSKLKKATEHKEFAVHVCVMDDDMYPYLDTEVNEGEYYIELSDLKNLPKEE